ncbi:mycofactocin system GMC family oxidoreductase MftG [Rhodococcus sp. BP-149]|uniref:mycofactocin dehydrogenase MftG n=1 Tax=unclassified Rhodococcus (in: high G+C Gram-positive bacteria) TaxID=192944 RepID=UPI001C9BAAE8|nr:MULTISPECIES: mycofactocin system GMC family oxidoreductase MftG [unclassified Rhodococcus (in: high G+C Gram-positive bacteria)]MBY6687816.1 mycofactocin system GMC family oxidoreductase MftG [Rhodococcus sp. BP-288]MBY6696081.1 mycofactocin system GMC family oxidoreductase MftG [Rhodococcus sp. BP-188]MBY6700678.1 mycofactocin system GMC family oxidoreductase MftG [Rhodococcus sp. BP-285]MBY6705075.1 mycofactocin system GMC family oxidoreductase MftG [Rhodococcus sp. BP-283]MBY6713803.1 m
MVDVIVVGGGSAGCVAAATFARAGASVLIIEAGPVFLPSATTESWPPDLTDVRRMPIGPESPYIDPITASTFRHRQFVATRGRVLGGSGAVNGAYFVRAPLSDFDIWPRDLWDRETVARYYNRIETDHDFGRLEHHGSTGPVPVTRAVTSRVAQNFQNAGRAAGHRQLDDLNAPTAGDGMGAVPSNVRDGRRISMAEAYLSPVVDRITVRGRSQVARLLFDGDKVIGVTGRDDDGTFDVHADRVVLAAGAIRTPNLLLHSGIGDADTLRRVGVPVVQHLPGVGVGMADHPEVTIDYRPGAKPAASDRGTPLQVVLHSGPIEIRPYTSSFDHLIPGLPPMLPAVGVAHMTPEARGVVTVVSPDPFSAPHVEHRYAETRADREALRTGIGLAEELLAISALVPYESDLSARDVCGWSIPLGGSLHTMCSARMGTDDDPLAVVDPIGRVRGVRSLSVVDASIFPAPVSRGPHATVVMAALRVSELQIE